MAGQRPRTASRGRCGTESAGSWAQAAGAELARLGEDKGSGRRPAWGECGETALFKAVPAPEWTPTPLSVAQDAKPLIHLATPSSKLLCPEAASSC